MIDDGGSTTPFRDDSFTDIVHDVGVENRHAAGEHFARVETGLTGLFSAEPFMGSVGAGMDHRMCFEYMLKPQIGGDVLMMWRQVLGLIEGGQVLRAASIWLY